MGGYLVSQRLRHDLAAPVRPGPAPGARAAQTHPTPRLPGFDGRTSTGGVQN